MQNANSKLTRLLHYLGIDQEAIERACTNSLNSVNLQQSRLTTLLSQLNNLTLDSREVNAQSIFLAITGHVHKGHDYLPQASQNGCVMAILETQQPNEHAKIEVREFDNAPSIICIYAFGLANDLGNLAYAFYIPNSTCHQWPHITAVTGTNGKTSVASLVAQLASLCGLKSATIGTLGINSFDRGHSRELAKTVNTTPDVVTLFSQVSELAHSHYDLVCLEASSHGLTQNRLKNLPIYCGIFTNLSQDHLDYHRSMNAYGAAKRKLLEAKDLHILVLNADDEESVLWHQQALSTLSIYWYSHDALGENQQGCWASDIKYSTAGVSFILHANTRHVQQQAAITSPLIGPFNVTNLVAAFTALIAQGSDFDMLCNATKSLHGVPGRMELFSNEKASILVDFAHTPDALKQALIAAREHTTGKLTCIFGCGGDRDNSKREIMGGIAEQFADKIILTQDNSRSESPLTIIEDIKSGISDTSIAQKVSVELNRKQAILEAWRYSDKNDMILVAGKGHEDYIEINGERIDYNERGYVQSMLSESAIENIFESKEGL